MQIYKALWAMLITATTFAMGSVTSTQAQQSTSTQQQSQISQAKAVEIARARVGGRLLRVEANPQNYRVKLLQDSGRVVSVVVDRRTGAILQAPPAN